MSSFLPRAAVILLIGLSVANAQPIVGGVFRIGELPPRFTVYQDQSLQLTIVSPVANGVLSLQFSAAPKGTTTFSATTGIFTYQPAQEDKAEFAVTFKATPPTGASASQTIFITPLPFLRPDRDFIQNRRAPPDETSGVYLKYTDSVSPADKSRSAEISGRTVTLQAGGKEFGLINYVPPGAGAPVNGDLRDLKIYAETVIIRSPLFLPSCNVTIWAQELRFEDPPNTLAADRARLDTTPVDRDLAIGKPPDPTKDGVAGLKGGSVTLHVARFASIPLSTTTNGIIGPIILNILRIRALGGNGQQAGQGLPGAPAPNPDLRPYIAPNPYPAGSHTETYKCGLFNLFDCDVVCSWNPFTTNSTIYIDVYCNGAYRYVWGVGGVWPGDGGNATPGGHPGGGGNGGDIGTTVDVAPSYANYSGSSGAYAKSSVRRGRGTPDVRSTAASFGDRKLRGSFLEERK